MTIQEAQADYRNTFMGGSVGQIVSGLVWLVSAALATWVSQGIGILALFAGGIFIFPLTQLVLRALGRSGKAAANNPFGTYFFHSVIAMGATYPLVYAATLYRTEWFYPAFMLAIGAHYMMFILFYGMPQFGVLAGILIVGGIALAMLLPETSFAAGGWLTGAVLVLFGLYVWRAVVPTLTTARA